MGNQRYLVTLSLVSFTTKTSSDPIGKGEFFFKINRRRFPNKGNIELGKMETFQPPANWILYCGIHEFSEELREKVKDHVKFHIQCFENDLLLNDALLDQDEIIKLAPCNNNFVMKSQDERIQLVLHITMEQTHY